jgi:hypothetical protein
VVLEAGLDLRQLDVGVVVVGEHCRDRGQHREGDPVA